MADARAREAPPPPVIGKVGRYTVFLTPPRDPKPAEACSPRTPSPKPPGFSVSPRKLALLTEMATPSPAPKSSSGKVVTLPEKTAPSPPPVQVPPMQFEKPAAKSSGSLFRLFWDAVVKVQDAHSSLDEYLADWFGLNQSKYQWALNDYFDNSGKEKKGGKADKPKETVSKEQAV